MPWKQAYALGVVGIEPLKKHELEKGNVFLSEGSWDRKNTHSVPTLKTATLWKALEE